MKFEELHKIPTRWRLHHLKRENEVVLGKMLQSEPKRDTDTEEYYLRSANLQWSGIDVSDVKTMWFSLEEKRQLSLNNGDLLVSEGGDVGRCCLWADEVTPCYFQNAINRVRPLRSGSSRFLFYWILNMKCSGFIDATVARITIAHLTAEKLERMPVPVVPNNEQRRIAAYLDASCAAIDRAIETKQKQLETLDTLRKSIIQKAVTQGINPKVKLKDSGVGWLGQIPKHWQCESLKRNANRIQTGTTPPTSTPEYFEEGTIPWFAPECFGRTTVLGEPKRMINELALQENKLRIFPSGTVFFVGIGATIGKVAILNESGSANQQIVGIECSHRMLGQFLAYQLKNYEGIIPRLAQFTTLPILNQTKVGYLPVLRPPISEQYAICAYIDRKEVELSKIEGVLLSQITTLTNYRKSLIHECVTGKRRITEADLAKVGANV